MRQQVAGVDFHPQSNQLLTGGADGSLKLWAVPSAATQVITHPEAVLTASLSADGKTLFTGSNDKVFRSWVLGPTPAERW